MFKTYHKVQKLYKVKVVSDSELSPKAFEQVFSNLYGVRSGVQFFIGRVDGVVGFYFSAFESDFEFIALQIRSFYAGVLIDPVGFEFGRFRFERFLKLGRPDLYPVKRYQFFEDKINLSFVDPIGALCNSIEDGFVCFEVRALSDRWRRLYVRCLKFVSGRNFLGSESLKHLVVGLFISRSFLLRILLWPIYVYFWVGSLFVSDIRFKEDETRLQFNRETSLEGAVDKVSKLLYRCRVKICSNSFEGIERVFRSFSQFNIPGSNGFVLSRSGSEIVLNNEELASLYHYPHRSCDVRDLDCVIFKRLCPPLNLPNDDVTRLGENFGVSQKDICRHFYIVGKTGMGKSTLIENMIHSDILLGRGVGVIDPHGDLASKVVSMVPKSRTNDLVILDATDFEYPVSINLMDSQFGRSVVCSGLISVFKKMYGYSWGPRLEHILRNTILALIEYGRCSILGISRMLTDKNFREVVVGAISDPVVKKFWENEFSDIQNESLGAILNKVGQFLSSREVRNILGQTKSSIDFRFAMDTSKIVVVNLSKGIIGEDSSSLLGSMIITKFQIDAMSRANISLAERVNFNLYVDEFQNFATDSFATILSEARKYGLSLILANQYISQMSEEVCDSVFGNVGSILSFQVGAQDASVLVEQFGEQVSESDLVNLDKYNAYLKLLVDGMPSKVFSFETLGPVKDLNLDSRKMYKVSRERYGRRRDVVERGIEKWICK